MSDINFKDLDNFITGHWGEDSVDPDDDQDYLTLTFGQTVELAGILLHIRELSAFGKDRDIQQLDEYIELLGRADNGPDLEAETALVDGAKLVAEYTEVLRPEGSRGELVYPVGKTTMAIAARKLAELVLDYFGSDE